jgi:hypothetical protein
MSSGKKLILCSGILIAFLCNGCAPPHFDVPVDSLGQPTVQTIVYRIECEIRDMVRDDMGDKDITSSHSRFLLNGHYDVAISLSLEVNDTGGLAPNLSYINPLGKAASFVFGGTMTLSEARDHNFTENIQLSVRKIYTDWKTNANRHDCPKADTNLAGTLGIKDFVAMADLTPDLDESQKTPKSVFGGSMQFTVTKNFSAVGPTWSLVHFKGPGGLASLSEVNTDKITLAFAQGPNAGQAMHRPTLARAPNSENAQAVAATSHRLD